MPVNCLSPATKFTGKRLRVRSSSFCLRSPHARRESRHTSAVAAIGQHIACAAPDASPAPSTPPSHSKRNKGLLDRVAGRKSCGGSGSRNHALPYRCVNFGPVDARAMSFAGSVTRTNSTSLSEAGTETFPGEVTFSC